VKKKIIKWFAIPLLIFGLLLGLFISFFDFDKVLNEQKDRYLPELEKVLGRAVEVGEIETAFLPVLGAELRNVVIRGRSPGEAPLLKLERITFGVELWTAIRSAGSEVRLKNLILHGLKVNLVREADGSLSYEDILKRLSEGPPPDEQPKPLDPEAKKFIKNLQLARVALEDGEIRLVDKGAGGAETSISKLLVELNDVHLVSSFELHVAAAMLSEQENFDLRVKLGPLPIGEETPLPVEWVKLKTEGIDLAALTPYLGEVPVKIDQARFSSDLQIKDPLASKGRIQLKGELALKQLAMGGPSFDLFLRPNLLFDAKEGILDLEGFSLAVDEMRLKAGGRVEGLNLMRPSFDKLKLQTENMHLGKLLERFPQGAASLPPKMKLDGPFAINVEASGTPEAQDIKLDMDLNEAYIFVPGALDKPSKVPLNTHIDAHLTRKDLDLKELKLEVGPLNLSLMGTVKDFEDPTLDIKGETGSFPVGGLMRLLPNVRSAIPANVKIAGSASVSVLAKGSAKDMDAHLVLALNGTNLAVPGTTVRGSGRLEAGAKGSPESLALNLNLGLSGLEIVAGEAFKKPGGSPFTLKVAASKVGNSINIRSLALQLGPLGVNGSGRTHLKSQELSFQAKIPPFSLQSLSQMLPALKETPISKAKIGMNLSLSGVPSKLASMQAEMKNFSFVQGASDLRGQLKVRNLESPHVRFDFNSKNLALDELLPTGGKEEAPQEESGPPPPIVKKIDAAGALRVAKGSVAGIDFRNFIAALTLKNGILRFSKLDLDAYKGHLSVAPTEADIGSAIPRFDLSLAMKNVSSAQVLEEQGDIKDTLSGRMGTQIKIKGRGKGWEQMAPTLSGVLGLSLKKGRFHKMDLRRELVEPLVAMLPFIKMPRSKGGIALSDLVGQFSVANGKMSLKKPMIIKTPDGPLELSGAIGLDQSLNLKGRWRVSPKLIALITANKVKLKKPLPIGLKIGGTFSSPKIVGIEVKAFAKELGVAYAKQAGLGKLEKEARRRLKEAERKAKAIAKRELAKAKAKAKKELDKAKAKAKKAAARARKRAEREARKRLKGIF